MLAQSRLKFSLGMVLVLVLGACGGQPSPPTGNALILRMGYFPNITHSQALIGLARGDFQQALGADVTIQPTVFNAGPSVIEALFAKQIDLAYIGPNPAINGYVQSKGEALRIVAGATSGGAALVLRAEVNAQAPSDLAGKRLASPQLGNTQDVALRSYLLEHGLLPVEQGGDVQIIPTQNPQILDLFKSGEIDGAWAPEPWASRLVVEGGGKIFVDERDLWPDGDFTTACIIVSTEFLRDHPEAVRAWLTAHVEVTQWELANPAEAQILLNAEIEKLAGKKLREEVLAQAWSRLRPTWEPLSDSLVASADAAYAAGFLKEQPNLSQIYDLTLLNIVLQAKGLEAVP